MERGGGFALDLGAGLSAAGVIGSWVHDMVSDRVIADAQLTDLFGIARPDLANGDAIGLYAAAIHPDDRKGFAAEIERSSRLGSSFACRYRIVAGDEVRWVNDFGSFVVDEHGRPRQGRGIILDVTEAMSRDICTAETLTAPTARLHRQIIELADHVIGAGILAKALGSPRLVNLTTPLLFETGRLLAKLSSLPSARRRRTPVA